MSVIDWENFKYMVFDIPNHEGTYAERYKCLGTLFPEMMMLVLILPSSYAVRQYETQTPGTCSVGGM